jgi:TPR repeat protein
MYQNGRGVTKDESEAVKWYRKSAEQGNEPAQYNLGVMYANGLGVAKDESEAVKWYRKSAEQGDADAKDALKRLGY